MSTTAYAGATTSTAGVDLEPVYFGRGGTPLFGCFHPASDPLRGGSAIVICQPFGQEYIRCHRMLRVLATLLAQAGVPVLRFDYYGCGDSHGDGEEATLSRCVDDLGEAVRFLRGRTRLLNIELLGVRLGAAIALRFGAARRGQTERIVLWDPVVRGTDFLASMREQGDQYSSRMQRIFGRPPSPAEADGPLDFIGFRFSAQMVDELAGLDLGDVGERPCSRALILDSGEEPAAGALCEHLDGLGVATLLERLPAPRIWLTEPDQGLVPHAALEFITRWILESRQ